MGDDLLPVPVDPRSALAADDEPAMLLVEYCQQAVGWLRLADDQSDVIEVHARLRALVAYAETAKLAREAVVLAREGALRAERRVGELDVRVPPGENLRASSDRKRKSAPAGLSYRDRYEARRLAAIPQETFDAVVDDLKAEGREPSRGAVVARTKQPAKKKRKPPVRKPPSPEKVAAEAEALRLSRATILVANAVRQVNDLGWVPADELVAKRADNLWVSAEGCRGVAAYFTRLAELLGG